MTLTDAKTGHVITPLKASARRLGGASADLLNPCHYPVSALCIGCGQPIRCERFYRGEWEHAGQPQSGT